MTDELKLNQERARGAQAEALLRNDVMQEAFNALKADYVKAWASTDASQAAARENYWQALQILADVQTHLKSLIANGRLAQRELDDLANKPRPQAV